MHLVSDSCGCIAGTLRGFMRFNCRLKDNRSSCKRIQQMDADALDRYALRIKNRIEFNHENLIQLFRKRDNLYIPVSNAWETSGRKLGIHRHSKTSRR